MSTSLRMRAAGAGNQFNSPHFNSRHQNRNRADARRQGGFSLSI
jgi:hypothetical protein